MDTETSGFNIDIEIKDVGYGDYFAKRVCARTKYMKRLFEDVAKMHPELQDFCSSSLDDSGDDTENRFEEIEFYDFNRSNDQDVEDLDNSPFSIPKLESEDYLEKEISRTPKTFVSGAELEAERRKGLAAITDAFAEVTVSDDIEHLNQMLKSGQVSRMEQQMVVEDAEGMATECW